MTGVLENKRQAIAAACMRHGAGVNNYRVEIEQEENGRFLAEVVDLPGVMAYGDSAEDALAHVQGLALRVLADRLEHDEGPRAPVSVRLETSEASCCHHVRQRSS